jgi:hypothetical protein
MPRVPDGARRPVVGAEEQVIGVQSQDFQFGVSYNAISKI